MPRSSIVSSCISNNTVLRSVWFHVELTNKLKSSNVFVAFLKRNIITHMTINGIIAKTIEIQSTMHDLKILNLFLIVLLYMGDVNGARCTGGTNCSSCKEECADITKNWCGEESLEDCKDYCVEKYGGCTEENHEL